MSGKPWLSLGAPAIAWCLAIGGTFSPAAELSENRGPGQTVSLEYREVEFRIRGWRLNIIPRSEAFRTEPAVSRTNICRGVIHAAFRGVQKPGEAFKNVINAPFLWDYSEGKLYLDMRRDGDLAKGQVFLAGQKPGTALRSGQYYYQAFTNIHLTFGAGADPQPRLVDIHLYGYGGQNKPGGNLTWRSFWQGKASLQGRDWQIGLIEEPNNLESSQGAYVLLRPWGQRDQPFSLEDGSLGGFPCPTNLFFQGRGYHLEFHYTKGERKYRLEMAEAGVELGEVALKGRFIDRLLLVGHQAQPPFTVVLDRPESNARIPIGNYADCQVYLKEKDAAAFRRDGGPGTVSISSSNTTLLSVGGPLSNSVRITRRGPVLSLEYQLRGADGAYSMLENIRTNPPQVAIYLAGKQVGSGAFEYG